MQMIMGRVCIMCTHTHIRVLVHTYADDYGMHEGHEVAMMDAEQADMIIEAKV